jgi:transcriptional regulator with XRE-family HTH domain
MIEDPREVVKCAKCLLVQFRTRESNCRRCLKALPPPKKLEAKIEPAEENTKKPYRELRFAENLRLLRVASGCDQGEFATRLRTHRTYVSRLENSDNSPSLEIFERLSEVFHISIANLMTPNLGGWFFEDPAMVEIAWLLPKLNANKRALILSAIIQKADEMNKIRKRNNKFARRGLTVVKQQAPHDEANQDAACFAGDGTDRRLPARNPADHQALRSA